MIYDVQSKKTCLFYQNPRKAKGWKNSLINAGKKGLIAYKPERICPCKRGLIGPGTVKS
jgi:hypothetical protein